MASTLRSVVARCLLQRALHVIALVLVPVSACASRELRGAEESKFGVVVEAATKNFEGDHAGLHADDVILAWSCGTERGEIQSPFDLADVETEQAQRCTVALEGLRTGQRKTWTLGANSWRISARPVLPQSLQAVYVDARALRGADAAQRWLQSAAVDTTQPSWLRAWLALQAADAWANAQEWNNADKAYQLAVDYASGAGRVINEQLLWIWARRREQHGDLEEAGKIYAKALMVNPGGESLSRAAIFNRLGILAAEASHFEEAASQYQHALDLRDKLAPGSLDVARVLNNLGLLAMDRGELENAERYHLRALEIRERIAPGTMDVATSLGNLGVVYRERGEAEKAEESQLRALKIRQELEPEGYDVTLSLLNLGVLARDSGDFGVAENYFNQALVVREKIAPNGLVVADCLNNLAEIALLKGDLIKAEELYRRALDIRNVRVPDSLYVAASKTNLGLLAMDREDLERAEELFLAGLAIKQKKAPGSTNEARSLDDLGNLALRRGQFIKARDYHFSAYLIRQKQAPGSLELARSLNNLGNVFEKLGNLSKAESYLHAAWEIEKKVAPAGLDLAETFGDLATVLRRRGAAKQAEDFCRRSIEITERLTPESARHAESLATLASLFRSQGRLDEAALLYSQALDMFERQAARLGGAEEIRAAFRAQFNEHYRAYIDVLMQQKKAGFAFQVFERSRVRSLLETLTEAHIDLRRGADPRLLERERSLQQMLAAQNTSRLRLLGRLSPEQQEKREKKTGALVAELQQVESDIRTSSPAYAALTQPTPVDVRRVQHELLDPETILLEYSLGDQRSYLWAVTQSSLTAYTLPKKAVLEAAARKLYRQLSLSAQEPEHSSKQAGSSSLEQAALTFRRMVLEPVARQLGNKRILVVADGALEYIPFAVLPVLGTSPPQAMVPLMYQHELVALPSATVLAFLRQTTAGRKQPARSVAVLADPVFDSDDPRVLSVAAAQQKIPGKKPSAGAVLSATAEDLTRSAKDIGRASLPRLPFSRAEAEAILSVAPGETSLKAMDFAASRTLALSPQLAQYRILHFATHGIINNQHPELSGLVLSLVDERGDLQNGFLELHDIYNLNLPIDLVVLSACETGLGKQIRGEGLMSLTRGFMHAGASRVMASMWTVNDAATAELMANFYKSMEQQKMRPAAALRNAQMAIWKQKRWSRPYFWGAFQVQGDWK